MKKPFAADRATAWRSVARDVSGHVCLSAVIERSDVELLEAWRAGDASAGQTLFSRHFRRIYRFFETKFGRDPDELVQSTFLACMRAKHQFRGESSFATYLYTIARHELYRALEHRRRDLGRIDFEASSIAELAPTPRTRLAAREDRLQLLEALRDLPVDQQVLLELHYWEEVDIAALSAIFDDKPVTIRSRLHRARTALRERMLKATGVPAGVSDTLENLDAWARSLSRDSHS
jgi:RNA polymerase sigma factor (sigma-70 family)